MDFTIEDMDMDLEKFEEKDIVRIKKILADKKILSELLFEYISEKIFSDNKNILSLARIIRRRLKNDFDSTILITGYPGIGKSCLGTILLKLIDRNSTLEHNVIWVPDFEVVKAMLDSNTSEETVKKIEDDLLKEIEDFNYVTFKELYKKDFNEKLIDEVIKEFQSSKLRFNKKYPIKRRGAVLIDEAVKILFKGDHAKKASKQMTRFYTICREENKCTIMIIPDIKDLSKYFREGRVNAWIHVPRRGLAIVFAQKTWDPFIAEPWFFKENEKIIKKISDKTFKKGSKMTDAKLLYLFSHCHGFIGYFTYDDWSEKEKIKYKLLKSIFKYAGITLHDGKKGPSFRYKKLYNKFWGVLKNIRNHYKLSQDDLSKVTGLTKRSIVSGMHEFEKYEQEITKNKKRAKKRKK